MKNILLAVVMLFASLGICVNGIASVMPSDEEWQQIKAQWLVKPRRVIVDDDGCDAQIFAFQVFSDSPIRGLKGGCGRNC